MNTDTTIIFNKRLIDPAEVAALYRELGWGTEKIYSPARMKKSLVNCDIVVAARNGAGELVGILRALSDFALETKILDLIIVPEYQRQGLGRRMMRAVESRARGTVIYFETERKNIPFAEKCGYARRRGLFVFSNATPTSAPGVKRRTRATRGR